MLKYGLIDEQNKTIYKQDIRTKVLVAVIFCFWEE